MRVHFIFICGSGVAQMAVIMKSLGHNVTGSDNDIYPPVSTYLENNEINVLNFGSQNITKDTDLVVLGGSTFIKVANQHNEEYEEAKRLGIKILGWDELVGDILSSQITIDVVGTYGKSTCSALLAWILTVAKYDPSYMIGALPLNFKTGAYKSDSDYSVFEGDEHPLLHYHKGGKFMYHKPTHVLITAAKWDHINVYKTPNEYIECYKNLITLIKNPGFIVANIEGENILQVIEDANVPIIFYSSSIQSIKKYENLKSTSNKNYHGLYVVRDIKFGNDNTQFVVDFVDFPRNENWKLPDQILFESPLIGLHNIENALGDIAMSLSLGVDLHFVQEGIRSFKNVKRRLEVVGRNNNNALIIDDLAHSPVKAKETLKALRTRYKDNRIIAIFDAHSSLLKQKEVLDWLPGTFDLANEVIIPKIILQKDIPKDKWVFGKDIVEAIAKTQPNVKYMPIDENLIDYLNSNTKADDIIIFMSSGSWRDIITSIIK